MSESVFEIHFQAKSWSLTVEVWLELLRGWPNLLQLLHAG